MGRPVTSGMPSSWLGTSIPTTGKDRCSSSFLRAIGEWPVTSEVGSRTSTRQEVGTGEQLTVREVLESHGTLGVAGSTSSCGGGMTAGDELIAENTDLVFDPG